MGIPPGPRLPMPVQTYHWFKRPVEFLLECRERYGDTFTIRLPNSGPIVVTCHADTIKSIFTGPPDVLHAGKAAEILRDFAGDHSLLLLDGRTHLRERKLMLPPFHGERMREYMTTMRQITVQDIERWPRDAPLPLHPHLQHITLQVILRTVFGVQEPRRLQAFSDQLTRLLELMTRPTVLLQRLVPFTFGTAVKVDRALAVTDVMIYEEIEQRRKSDDIGQRGDVLSMLLSAVDEEGNPMSDIALRDELMTLLVAGHETSATALAWTLKLLLANPPTLQKAQAEVDAVLGNDELSEGALGAMSYLDAVLKEALRLRPVVPMVARVLQVPMSFRGFDLPANAIVAPSIVLAHLSPDNYDDPMRFDPDRFVGKKTNPYTWLPFGGGVRRCLGQAFALYEMKVVLATILQKVDLVADARASDDMVRRGITFAPRDGTRVVARERVQPVMSAGMSDLRQ